MSHKYLVVFATCALALSLGGCASAPSATATPTPTPVDLQRMMTPAQFKAAGLDRLSPDEIKALDGWLADHAGMAEAVQKPAAEQKDFGLAPKPKPQPDSIDSRIDGHFDGWDGNTVFKLQNGQVWQQAGFGSFAHHAENPQVHIWKGWFGYLMRIKGYNATVSVRRIK